MRLCFGNFLTEVGPMLRRLNKQPTTSITGLLYGLARSPSTTKSQALRFSCQFVVVGTLSVVRNILVVMAVLTGVAVSSSVLTIAVLSADRLLAVRRPLSLAVYRASRHTWLIVAGVWLASLAIAAPLLDVRRLNTVSLGFGTHNTFSFCHEASRYFASPHPPGRPLGELRSIAIIPSVWPSGSAIPRAYLKNHTSKRLRSAIPKVH